MKWREGRECPPIHLLARIFGLNGDFLRMTDGVWRAGSLGRAGGGQGEDKEFSCAAADRVQVGIVVPEELIDLGLREQTSIVRDRAAAVEVEDLQPRRASNREQLA